jgi:beta-glucosidase
MNAFNDVNGIPATGNAYLVKNILKDKWKFSGIVVSDWGSVSGMVAHGYVADNKEAALAAINAGCDMDMESRCYKDHLAQLVKENRVRVSVIDAAVRRILTKKFQLGLFDDPYKYCVESREAEQKSNPAHIAAARKLSAKSIVLLKNKGGLLPLSKQLKSVAFIGPFVKAVKDNLGFWSMEWPDDSSTIVTQWDGIKNKLAPGAKMHYAMGCNINDSDTSGFTEAIAAAQQAEVVIMSMGEARDMSGESKSRSSLQLPGVQEALIKAIKATGKPIVLLINAGRPLVFNWAVDHIPSIVYTWWLGSQAGNAIADVLFGDYNPSGKLPMTFPRSEGQVPVYYNHLNTGHPPANENQVNYVTGYIDQLNSPRYPFGYGLSYTNFSYSAITLDKNSFSSGDKILATITVTNTGQFDGEETVQLYLRDKAASLARPVKELKAFRKLFLKKGESQTVSFGISIEDLKFYDNNLNYVAEPGEFILYIGGNSVDLQQAGFTLL